MSTSWPVIVINLMGSVIATAGSTQSPLEPARQGQLFMEISRRLHVHGCESV
jgi:hypothetical protein